LWTLSPYPSHESVICVTPRSGRGIRRERQASGDLCNASLSQGISLCCGKVCCRHQVARSPQVKLENYAECTESRPVAEKVWGPRRMAISKRRIGVVLFQLGGPDTLEAIQPFLRNLFSDPDIIDFPGARLAREPLARLISISRAKKVQHHYSVIGGGSPIRHHTEQQARCLESKLIESGVDARCFVAMRYWHPFTAEAIEQIRAAGCEGVVLLPLYPQYSRTTTGSSLNEWNRLFRYEIPVYRVETFYDNELYLDAVVERIDQALARFEQPGRAEIVFSAHSVPMAVIEKGDPYQAQIEETVGLVMRRGKWSNNRRLCFQSKVGASRWLQPSLYKTIRDLAAEKVRQVCVVPISFVSDHVETLGEIDHEARRQATSLGIERFEVTSGLNDSPTFISALAQMVQHALRSDNLSYSHENSSEVACEVPTGSD
jgi:protoporphyrin/coproporphyrin ferrochelatase